MVSSNHDMNLIIKAKDQASGIINKTLGDWRSAVLGVGAAYLGFQGIKGIITGIIESGMEAEKAWNGVAASLKRHHYEVRQNIGAIQEFSSRMQMQTGISDELVAKGIQRLLDANMKLGDTYKVIQAAADLARAKDMDLMAATELLAKASMGVTDTLTRYGIVIDNNIPKGEKFAQVLDQINQRFGGAAQADMETMAGKWKRIGELWGDLKEELYTILIAQNAVVGGTDAITATLDRLTRGLKIYREEGFLAMIRAEDEERESIQRWEDWANRMSKVQDQSLWGIDSVRRLSEMNKMLTETVNIVTSFPTGPMSDAIDSMKELHEYMVGVAAAEDAAYLNSLADAWIKQQEMYSTAASSRINAVTQMKEEELEVYTEFDELIQKNEMEKLSRKLQQRKSILERDRNEMFRKEQAAMNLLANVSENAISRIVGSFKFLQTESAGVFKNMALDFTRLFIEESLRQLSLKFIGSLSGGGFLGMIASIFDTRANDEMAMKQGSDFAKYFSAGAMKQLSGFAPQISYAAVPAIAGASVPVTGQTVVYNNFYGVVAEDFIQKDVIPSVSMASKKRETSLYAVDDTRFGGSRVFRD